MRICKAITSKVAEEGQFSLGAIGDIEASIDSCHVTSCVD